MRKLIQSALLIPIVVLALAFTILFLRRFQSSVQRAREAACAQDAFVVQNAVSRFTLDKQHTPKSLQELVEANYLPAIPPTPCQGEPGLTPVLGDPIRSPHFSALRQVGTN
jgi:competence protein ComGC